MILRSRLVGAIVGGLIAAAAAAIALAIQHSSFLAAGIPAAATAGWLLGPIVPRPHTFARVSIEMCILTIAIADALVISTNTFRSASFSPDTFASSFEFWLFGLVFVGIPITAVVLPCAIAWTAIARRLMRPATSAPRL